MADGLAVLETEQRGSGPFSRCYVVFRVVAHDPDEALHVDPVARVQLRDLLGSTGGEVAQALVDGDMSPAS